MKTITGFLQIGELPPGEWKLMSYFGIVLLVCPEHLPRYIEDGELKELKLTGCVAPGSEVEFGSGLFYMGPDGLVELGAEAERKSAESAQKMTDTDLQRPGVIGGKPLRYWKNGGIQQPTND